MDYVKPQVLASYTTGQLLGTAVGNGSSCANNDPNNNCDHH